MPSCRSAARPCRASLASDFELRDNGVVQQLELAASDAQPLLAVLTFDISGSLEGEKLTALKAASQALLGSLRPEDEATLLTFGDQIDWLAPPTTDKNVIRQALDQLKPGGGTPVMDAFYCRDDSSASPRVAPSWSSSPTASTT